MQPELTARAFQIADESMFDQLTAHCVIGDESATVLGLVDAGGEEVTKLAEADPAILEAYEWLSVRGYVEQAEDAHGEHLVVLRRTDE